MNTLSIEELQDLLSRPISKQQVSSLAKTITDQQLVSSVLMPLFFSPSKKVAGRAAWILSNCAELEPAQLRPFLNEIIETLNRPPVTEAVKRNVLRVLQFVSPPEASHASLLHHCFNFLQDAGETVAVKVFAMSVLAALVPLYPEIANELVLVLEDLLENKSTPGIRSRARKVLMQLHGQS
jgi:hypothetical protein